MSDIITIRDVEIITTEIKTIEMQVAKMAIYGSIEIGRRLTEVKEIVGHGGWGKYLEEKVCYSQQWATNLMNLYKEYGGAQESLFDNFANSKSFGKIDVTKHILLLAVPGEERAAFAEAHDAENSTVRELKEAIRERDAAQEQLNQQTARAEQARNKAADLENQLDIAGDKLLAKEKTIKQLQTQAEEAQKKQHEAAGKVDKLKDQLAKAKDAEKAAKAALEEAKAKPEIPESVMEEMRQQVAADAAEKATAEVKKQLEEAKNAAAEAEKCRTEAETKAKALQNAMLLMQPDAVEFKMLFTQVQEDFNKLHGSLLKVRQNDPATGEKLKAAMVTLLDKLRKDIEA